MSVRQTFGQATRQRGFFVGKFQSEAVSLKTAVQTTKDTNHTKIKDVAKGQPSPVE
jgi:hypothetical protein